MKSTEHETRRSQAEVSVGREDGRTNENATENFTIARRALFVPSISSKPPWCPPCGREIYQKCRAGPVLPTGARPTKSPRRTLRNDQCWSQPYTKLRNTKAHCSACNDPPRLSSTEIYHCCARLPCKSKVVGNETKSKQNLRVHKACVFSKRMWGTKN